MTRITQPMVEVENLTKLYYSIGEVAEMFDVSPSLIRYWEGEFKHLKPQKNSKGDRKFTKQNVEQLNDIFFLVKEKGYTLEGAKKQIKALGKKKRAKQQVLDKLKKIKTNLNRISEELED